ncbi:MAG TPA: hypothetical protein VKA89_08025 [Solirubrobacterales bacterium]|nr:hypothetical protein [Solirubrobacterales bacterium]
MFKRVGSHLRRNPVAYAALFVALGGTAVALPGHNSVRSDDIAPKAVKKSDLATGAVGARQANEASFKGLVRGKGKQVFRTFTAPAVGFLPQPLVLADVPTMGQVRLIYCGTHANNDQMRIQQLSDDDAAEYTGVGYVTASDLPAGTGKAEFTDFDAGQFSGGGGGVVIAQPNPGPPGPFGIAALWDYKLYRGSGANARTAHVSVSGYNSSSSITPAGQCHVTAETVMNP